MTGSLALQRNCINKITFVIPPPNFHYPQIQRKPQQPETVLIFKLSVLQSSNGKVVSIIFSILAKQK